MNQGLYEAFFKKSPVAFSCLQIQMDPSGIPIDFIFTEVNHAFLKMFDLEKENLIGKRFYEMFSRDSLQQDAWHQKLLASIQRHENIDEVVSDLFPNKSFRVKIYQLNPGYLGLIIRDVTIEVRLGNEVEGFMNVDVDLLCIADTEGNFIRVNHQSVLILGFAPSELEKMNILSLVHEDDLESAVTVLSEMKNQREVASFISRCRCKDGSYKYLDWRCVPNGKYVYASARDVTETIKREETLRNAAIIDPLTGLYNRNFFYGRVAEEINRSQSGNLPLSMISVDIDHFKYVNDIWGHPVGDEILERTAMLLKTAIRSTDYISRIGGEEFVVLLPNTAIDGAMSVANKMRDTLDHTIHPRIGKVTASFGVAERKKDEDFNHWYKRADDAVYVAKDHGRNMVWCAGSYAPSTVASIYLDWKQEWNCGIEIIDEQHRELVEIGNKLIYLSQSGAALQQISRQADQLLDHVAIHFSTEEKIIGSIGFPGFSDHVRIHRSLTSRASEIVIDFQEKKTKSPIFLAFIINDLIIGHMLQEDVKFYSYLPKSSD